MTEEEMAEEIAKDIYIHHFDDDINYPYVLKAITVGVQKGAEFGYNKCKDELVVKTKEIAKEVIEYLLTSLKIEGCDLSESGCKTKDYEIYRKAISLIEDKESEQNDTRHN